MVKPPLLISEANSSFKANSGFILMDTVMVLIHIFTDTATESDSEKATVMLLPIVSLLPVQYNKKFSAKKHKTCVSYNE